MLVMGEASVNISQPDMVRRGEQPTGGWDSGYYALGENTILR